MDVALWTSGLATVALVVGLARVVALDGYGSGRVPRSHHDAGCAGGPGRCGCAAGA